jgi:N12 class adenine-specific DNA methylase
MLNFALRIAKLRLKYDEFSRKFGMLLYVGNNIDDTLAIWGQCFEKNFIGGR